MLGIIFGIILTIGGIFFLWLAWKKARDIFHVCLLLSIMIFGEAMMCFCIGMFSDKNAQECESKTIGPKIASGYIDETEKDTSTYIVLKIDTLYFGRKCDYKEELEYENR